MPLSSIVRVARGASLERARVERDLAAAGVRKLFQLVDVKIRA